MTALGRSPEYHWNQIISKSVHRFWGWSGGAMALGKLSVPGRPTILITVGQGVGVVRTFLLSSILSFLFLPLFGRRPDID